MLDWVPVQLRVLRIRRPKYGWRACGTIHQVPAPERPIAKGLATPGLITQVPVSQALRPHAALPAGPDPCPAWRADRTLDPGPVNPRGGRTKLVLGPASGRARGTGRLWVYARDDRPWAGPDPPPAVYFYSPDRKALRPTAHLEGLQGVLQVDGHPVNRLDDLLPWNWTPTPVNP